MSGMKKIWPPKNFTLVARMCLSSSEAVTKLWRDRQGFESLLPSNNGDTTCGEWVNLGSEGYLGHLGLPTGVVLVRALPDQCCIELMCTYEGNCLAVIERIAKRLRVVALTVHLATAI